MSDARLPVPFPGPLDLTDSVRWRDQLRWSEAASRRSAQSWRAWERRRPWNMPATLERRERVWRRRWRAELTATEKTPLGTARSSVSEAGDWWDSDRGRIDRRRKIMEGYDGVADGAMECNRATEGEETEERSRSLCV